MKSIFLLLFSFLFVSITSVSFAADVPTTKKAKIEVYEVCDAPVVSITNVLEFSNDYLLTNNKTNILDVNFVDATNIDVDSISYFDKIAINHYRYLKPKLIFYSRTYKKDILIPYRLDSLYLDSINYNKFEPYRTE